MALLTPEEVEEFEKKIFINAAKDFLEEVSIFCFKNLRIQMFLLTVNSCACDYNSEFTKILFIISSQCPGCKSRVVRNDLNNINVECTECTASKRRTYRFCWQCLREWKGPAPCSDRCDNDGCPDPLETLKNCPDIVFEDVKGVNGCPCFRACPTCGILVEHNKT